MTSAPVQDRRLPGVTGMDISIHSSFLPHADQPYGLRGCAVRDPAANMVRIQQLS